MIEGLHTQRQPSGGDPRPTYYLQPGLLHVAEAATITTILGSCVAVCMWDSARQIGGMNHFLLPRGITSPGSQGRFGEHAVPLLIQQLLGEGAVRTRLQAKVFGGASVNGAVQRPDHLGLQNAKIALDFLAAANVAVVAQDVGGTRGRKLLFHTDDGTALVKYLGGSL